MKNRNGHLGIIGTWLVDCVLMSCPLLARTDEAIPTVWAHRPYVVRMAVTNRTAAVRTVVKVATSCACLTAKAEEGNVCGVSVLPGILIPFELTLNPAGMEGMVSKRAYVTFDDGTVETMTVRVNMRTRLKLVPSDAAFGVVERSDDGHEIVAHLKDERAAMAEIVGIDGPAKPFFTVERLPDCGGRGGAAVSSKPPYRFGQAKRNVSGAYFVGHRSS